MKPDDKKALAEKLGIEIYEPKQVVCYSGGHSSAIVGINAVKEHGAENVILLNHDINPKIESKDVKRFKNEVAEYLGLGITYANHENWATETPVSVCRKIGGWKFKTPDILCTYNLKTLPFYDWIEKNDPLRLHTYLYGFDENERHRVERRSRIMRENGCKTDFPLATRPNKIQVLNIEQVDIDRPNNYENFKHANCQGCLKAGWQHWYIINAHRKDIWQEAMEGEDEIGYAIHKTTNSQPAFLEEREELFYQMYQAGIPTTEHISDKKFWASARRITKNPTLLNQIDDAMMFDNSMACTSCSG